jgi:hypothetical protein
MHHLVLKVTFKALETRYYRTLKGEFESEVDAPLPDCNRKSPLAGSEVVLPLRTSGSYDSEALNGLVPGIPSMADVAQRTLCETTVTAGWTSFFQRNVSSVSFVPP